MSLSDFPWPVAPGDNTAPAWTGTGFMVGDRSMRVVSYQTEPSHWSEDLTALHETESGRDHAIDRASRRLVVRTMRRLAGLSSPIILDVGCSSGYILEELRSRLPHADLIGADYLRGPLESLARRIPDIPILQFDLRRCPLPNDCVDGITCLNVLEHIDDHDGALGHIYRILKPGGLAHIEVPAGPELFDIYDESLMHHRRYRLGELVSMARTTGFTVEKATHLGFMVYPAFWWVKRRNRRHLSAPPEEKMRLVARQIRSTRTQPLLAAMIRLETVLGRVFSYPCGIRCVVVLRKT
jgi:ubiquinone/menaquinone biosynthesis C-methylase UbiE